MNTSNKALRVYGCGGCGINIVKQAADLSPYAEAAALNPVYVDTSTANFRSGFDKENKFVVDNLNGGGKVQSENIGEISRSIDTLLAENQPAHFNIIVGSASGGSGCVISTLLAKTLLSRNIPTVVLLLGTTESSVATANTIKTIKSLDGVARKANIPVNVYCRVQQAGELEQLANTDFVSAISKLAVIASQKNENLDIRDLHNFVFHNQVSSTPGQLMALDIIAGEFEPSDLTYPSMVELLPNRETAEAPVPVFYRTTGYSKMDTAIRAAITPDLFPGILKELSKVQATYDKMEKALTSTKALSDDSECDDEGCHF